MLFWWGDAADDVVAADAESDDVVAADAEERRAVCDRRSNSRLGRDPAAATLPRLNSTFVPTVCLGAVRSRACCVTQALRGRGFRS